MMALLATAAGTATVHETVFEGRMAHARELQRMGADITLLDGSSARIHGETHPCELLPPSASLASPRAPKTARKRRFGAAQWSCGCGV